MIARIPIARTPNQLKDGAAFSDTRWQGERRARAPKQIGGYWLEIHRLPLIGLVLVLGGLAFASYQPSVATANATAVQQSQSKAAPKSVKKATKLVRQSATQLAKDYAKGRAFNVCTGLTSKARKSLGGGDSCVLKVKRATGVKPISKISIKKVVLRSARTWATISGYLNGNRTQRLSVVFKWESGRYRLDHSVTALSGILR